MPETASERLLREIRARDKLFDTYRSLQALTNPASELQKRISDLTGSSALKLASQVKETPYSRALEVAQQLSQSASGVSPRLSSAPRATPASTPVHAVSDLGPMVRKARKAMKLNQTEFAAHAGVGRRFVSELESGKPSLEFDKVMACAAAAGIDLRAAVRKG